MVLVSWNMCGVICEILSLSGEHGPVGRVYGNVSGDLGSITGRVIPKTLKMVLDASLLYTQQYKVRIKGKVELSRERSSALPYTSVQLLLKREPSGRPRLRSPTLLLTFINISSLLYLFDVIRSSAKFIYTFM